MDPLIGFKCSNADCEQFGIEIRIEQYRWRSGGAEVNEEYWFARSKHCRKCYTLGELIIQHGARNFHDLDAFGEYVAGLAKEYRLLKKLKDRGVAETDELKELENVKELLAGVPCPCCGQSFIDSEHEVTSDPLRR